MLGAYHTVRVQKSSYFLGISATQREEYRPVKVPVNTGRLTTQRLDWRVLPWEDVNTAL